MPSGVSVTRPGSFEPRTRRRVQARTIYDPRFATAENLLSCWMARAEMDEDFVLLNGDAVFEPAVLGRLLAAPHRPIVIAIDHKTHYDADNMKVWLQGGYLQRVGMHAEKRARHGASGPMAR